ncbi:hypothetical protein GQ607_004494 [Colletotrichum asianum]|uniref:Uncharacterized protein n=1 Tax=Colletotrichum asianum TaxID=702518 RepID=A0A8H3ZUV4_9PEZI|nr:hypothetical protein GQ607_004494 [Colletotrichum asianum]
MTSSLRLYRPRPSRRSWTCLLPCLSFSKCGTAWKESDVQSKPKPMQSKPKPTQSKPRPTPNGRPKRRASNSFIVYR